jgi:predicted RNA-binding Zn-ribbon protein involved in translation (DUF1610 family)
MTTTPKRSNDPVNRKASLFCPACGYEAPVDGEWIVEGRQDVDGRYTVVACPDCDHVVVDQPQFGLLA